jgi:hypothetical protein
MKAAGTRTQALPSQLAPRRRPEWALTGRAASSFLNAVIYQIGWFACVLGAAWGWGSAGAALALVLTALHLALAQRPVPELLLVAVAAAVGLTVDSLHAGFGVLAFNGHEAGTLAPLWIVALWAQFGTVMHFCMRWLSKRYLLASVLGLIGGPMSFLAGERLGAAAFGEPRTLSLAVLGLSWSIVLPALAALADRLGEAGRYRIFVPAARSRARGSLMTGR